MSNEKLQIVEPTEPCEGRCGRDGVLQFGMILCDECAEKDHIEGPCDGGCGRDGTLKFSGAITCGQGKCGQDYIAETAEAILVSMGADPSSLDGLSLSELGELGVRRIELMAMGSSRN